MNELLKALGRRPSFGHKGWLVGLFLSSTLTILSVRQIVYRGFKYNDLVIHIGIWGLWFCWQAFLFPLNRERYLQSDPGKAYRSAFYRDILPGASLCLSQLLWPICSGFLAGIEAFSTSQFRVVIALASISLGLFLLYAAVETIGIAAALFLYEYRDFPPKLAQRNVYGYIRHPLFLGAILASFGVTLSFAEGNSVTLAVVNFSLLPIYRRLEDARLIGVFGECYSEYRSSVGGFIPKSGLLRRLVMIA